MFYNVAEKFISINGEGRFTGQLAVFIRFYGCNLFCGYCDTKWANDKNCKYERMSLTQVVKYVLKSGVKNVTLTGGEPLIQRNIDVLLKEFSRYKDINIEIETNGSVSIADFSDILGTNIYFTMDYKLPSSGMSDYMIEANVLKLGNNDVIKFVASDLDDLIIMNELIKSYDLRNKTNVYISAVFGKLDNRDIVEFMKSNMLNDVTLQLQIHKVIWGENSRGC